METQSLNPNSKVVAVLSCIDRRFAEYLDEKYVSNKNTTFVFYSTEAASVFGVEKSLLDAIVRRGASEIKILCHNDCAAMGSIADVLAMPGKLNDSIDGHFVSQFAYLPVVKSMQFILNRRGLEKTDVRHTKHYGEMLSHIEQHNPTVQESYLRKMFSDRIGERIGLKISAELVSLKDRALDPKEPIHILITNSTTATAGQIRKDAGDDIKQGTSYIIRATYPSEIDYRIWFAVMKIKEMQKKNLVGDCDIRVFDSAVPKSIAVTDSRDLAQISTDPFAGLSWSEKVFSNIRQKQLPVLDNWKISLYNKGRMISTETIRCDNSLYVSREMHQKKPQKVTVARV